MKYYFLRHGKLDLPYKDHFEIPFEVMVALGLNKIEPGIDIGFAEEKIKKLIRKIDFLKIDKIYFSPIKRCERTALLMSKFVYEYYDRSVETKRASELKEVSFDLSKMVEKSKDLNRINEFVFRNIINGENAENYREIFKKVDALFCKKGKGKGDVIFITHDFLMRIIEIFIKNKGKIPKKISAKNLRNTNRNNYLNGFVVNSDFSNFTVISY